MKNFEIKIMNNMCLDGIIPSSIFEIKENHLFNSGIAQSVERGIVNPQVSGSNPFPGAKF